MKKNIGLCIFMLIIVLISNLSYAVETPNAELKVVANKQKIQTTDKTVEVIISLGNLQGLEKTGDKIVLGYEATLAYDIKMFKIAKVEGLNGWSANYETSTGKIVADTVSASANTDITKITLTLNDNIESVVSGDVKVNNLTLTDGTNDFTINKNITITNEIKANSDEDSNNKEENIKQDSTKKEETAKENSQNKVIEKVTDNQITTNEQKKVDSSTATGNLPKAGFKNIALLIFMIIVITGGFSFIRYKMIKLK